MDYFLIYLIGIADSLKKSLEFSSFIVLMLSSAIAFMFYINELSDTCRSTTKRFLKVAIISAIVLVISWFIPNSKTLIAMATIPPVINNEQVQELPENVLGFINDYLKDKRNALQGIPRSPDEV